MFGLVDANAFYCNVHRIFRPELRGKPVVVLSNGDGAIVSKTVEFKALGLPDNEPFFKVRELYARHGVHVFSSNYALYGDISARVVDTLRDFAAEVEVYSVDECFFTPLPELFGGYKSYGHAIKKEMWRRVRMPVGVGIAPTKTLAKACNRMAKTLPQLEHVCVMENETQREWLLRRTKIKDVWGVGSRISRKLIEQGIHTAWDLANANPKSIRKQFNVVLEKTVLELNGTPCLELEEVEPEKQQMYCTRSFSEKLSDYEPIREALAGYCGRVSEKLRQQKSRAGALHVLLQTSRFTERQYHNAVTIKLPHPTNDTRIITEYACFGLEAIYRKGYAYAKTGVGVLDLSPLDAPQADMFHAVAYEASDRIMGVIDTLNERYGRGTVFLAAQRTGEAFNLKKEFDSPAYTTNWAQIPSVLCD